ncbi:hypothetical protein BU24DRAFT_3956 [Aaosphaeria arxii CBS 175.79]|uniref:A to I editase domain-containing protein n=1 Tax=Aaosphaeria arxii CBS 175.79 TaxID=1450172 RepID=A0A6A5Y4Y0_9PLEO|nr:uncharacterized protein BU24DRAFT_3956 [Aaosphaeria arxii CBS 175.79]KAF2020612.1 hypothetical protein BU24DRAFT_3956 [Aaosphaeria arxii CBS 175.79]
MKCLPTSKLSQARGNVLHDWHAEIVALRAFNRFLLDECLSLVRPPHTPSRFIVQINETSRTDTEFQPFKIRDDVQIHMYCSEAPCGDASMELVMSAQEDATPWTSPPPTISSPEDTDTSNDTTPLSALRGRSHFSHLGAVRLKPSRPDAPPTLSKSCTDKLALTQCTSILSSLTSLLVAPGNAYIASLVLPESQYVASACERAFSASGRMSAVDEERWKGGYRFQPFAVRPTAREFAHSRRSVPALEKAVPCNISAVHTPHFQETLIGGVLQGRKQFDPRGASQICRTSMWRGVLEVASMLAVTRVVAALGKRTYADVKGSGVLGARRVVKDDVRREALAGWVRNGGDGDFDLK